GHIHVSGDQRGNGIDLPPNAQFIRLVGRRGDEPICLSNKTKSCRRNRYIATLILVSNIRVLAFCPAWHHDFSYSVRFPECIAQRGDRCRGIAAGRDAPSAIKTSQPTVYHITVETTFVVPEGNNEIDQVRIFQALPTRRPWDPQGASQGATEVKTTP